MNKRYWLLGFSLTLILGIWIVRGIRLSRVEATGVSCLATQRVVMGALELYREDHPDEPLTEDLLALGGQKLVDAKVLHAPVVLTIEGLRDIPFPKDRVPSCRLRLTSPTPTAPHAPVLLSCDLHGSNEQPASLAKIVETLDLDFWGAYRGR